MTPNCPATTFAELRTLYPAAFESSSISAHWYFRSSSLEPNLISTRSVHSPISLISVSVIQLLKPETWLFYLSFLHHLHPFSPSAINLKSIHLSLFSLLSQFTKPLSFLAWIIAFILIGLPKSIPQIEWSFKKCRSDHITLFSNFLWLLTVSSASSCLFSVDSGIF